MLEPTPIIGDECHTYKEMCKELEIFPIGRVCRSLFTGILNLKYYVPVEKQMKAICRTLEDNKFIQELNLQDNWLSVESCSYLMSLLQWNRTLTVLKLKECRIGPQGMAVLSESLGASFIEDLDLSFNSLGDEGIKNGIHGLGDNQKMKKLNLSHNELTEESAIYLNEILSSAGSLEELNLAWNCFNTVKGMKILCEGFKNAESLRWISLAWNGISKEQTVIPLARYVWRDLILQFLDLSNNLLKGNALKFIIRGISESKSLLHVKIGNNIFSPQQAFNSAQFLARPRTRPLKLLDMENMVVQRRFLDLLQRIREQGKDVIHGTVLTNYEIYGPYIPKVLFERCRYLGMKPKKKRRRKDFGQFVLSLPKRSITSSEFQAILQAKKFKSLLDYDLVTAVQNQYMNQKTQKIDCSQLVDDYMLLYPYTKLAPKKKRKARRRKGKNKKAKTRDKEKKSKPEVEEPPSVKVIVDNVFAEPSDVENITDNAPEPSKTTGSVNEDLQGEVNEKSIEKSAITTEGRKKKMKTKDGKRDSSKSQSIDLPSVKDVIDNSFVPPTAENEVENANQPLKTDSQTRQLDEPVQIDTAAEVVKSATELEKKGSLVAKPSFTTKAKKRASFAMTPTENENEIDTKREKNPLRASGVFILDESET
ncbi:hypothetical protein WA026_004852 [Henosepilachna vigintioctopunctata]|uniref:Uncharacterized protein n=1 Tax=Henosepilachna vigintioctopunctata TaxID=420089 RepID=A0AAW1ULE8_9CUCU